MRLLNIAKNNFVITNKIGNVITIKSGDIVDVSDEEAVKLTKCYPNSWKNIDIKITDEAPLEESKKEDAPTTKTTSKKKK